jgi:peroxin-19
MADPNTLDAMLDEALDELDDSDNDENDQLLVKTVPQARAVSQPMNDATPFPCTTRTEDGKLPATIQNSSVAPPPVDSFTSVAPPDPSEIFQKMLRDFMEADDDGGGDPANCDDIDAFMQQVQEQLRQNSRREQSGKASKNDKNKKSGSNDNRNHVEDTIAAILGEMAKASLEEPTDSSGASGSGAPTSDEERMLQEMLQSLAGGSLPEGMEDMMKAGDLSDIPGDFNPDEFMDGMMEQLLSKEIMYEPMKQVCEKFPQWLESHMEQLSTEELERRTKQFKVFQELVTVYEDESGNNQTGRLMDLMQQVQEYGQPPSKIINEIAPALELDEEGMPKLGGFPFGAGGPDEECTIM